ncbi:2,4-dienoyl-CoA reductase-like NADH-dependent reductase (Old Yellow Enzyme family) [Promicromonospora sp. AC04]|uniref:NADH:flavin oxidoreductase/NADH oxidase n=1 Tax=Promicromonospora sp. AC04 TaxID=2135723 RepID=UPI000D33749D|nr:NADH:flavin oxidoreductase/NADH oxidase [Promicromonospora sp. AC04]PUB24004.1 2,4-dienoyl-CoA reductase-like NADH-dependent reductase (Old Yellow Enzyme family) [Promicromonospora sp. AC04]
MSLLFEPIALRGLSLPNRVWLAPMCEYSAVDGVPNDWHLVHLGTRAVGGFGLVLTEATAVVPEGRISPEDTGIWNDEQTAAWKRIVDFVHERGARIGIQLAHAGRKASTFRPWSPVQGSVPVSDGGWPALGPSASPYPGYATPAEMTPAQVADVPEQFAAAARRAREAGFDTVEVHAAHGYLLHEFLSPLANSRTDEYGGSAEGRARLVEETVGAVRSAWPDDLPVLVRLSATDWLENGLAVDDVAAVAGRIGALGADLVDVSTGGVAPATIPVGPGYQVPHARRVREVTGLPVSAVGLISEPAQAEQILVEGSADAVMLGREALRDPYWPLRAAHTLREKIGTVPVDSGVGAQPQYKRAQWR